jgi:hypothetical protein
MNKWHVHRAKLSNGNNSSDASIASEKYECALRYDFHPFNWRLQTSDRVKYFYVVIKSNDHDLFSLYWALFSPQLLELLVVLKHQKHHKSKLHWTNSKGVDGLLAATFFSNRLSVIHWLFGREPITVAAQPREAWNVFARSNAGIVCSNPTQGIDVCLLLFCVCMSCVGSGLASGSSPVQGVLPTV